MTGGRNVRIGVISYADWTRTDVSLGSNQTRASVLAAAEKITYRGGRTVTASAVRVAIRYVYVFYYY